MKKSLLSIVLACLFLTAQAEELWHIVGTNDYVRTECLRKISLFTDSTAGASLYFGNIPQNPGAADLPGLYDNVFNRLVQTGSMMPAGSPDIRYFDESSTSFNRCLWYLYELPTDEGWYIWEDQGIPDFQRWNWQDDNTMLKAVYMRLLHNLYLQNMYLETASKLNLYPEEQKQVRFVRALTAWYMLDLFPSSHFTTQVFIDGTAIMSRQQLYSWMETELQDLAASLPQTRPDLYHVDADAAKMLLARLYLNAGVYTGTPQWANAANYAQQVMTGQHPLHTDGGIYSPYQELFMGDNDTNGAQEETLLMLKQDGNSAYSYGGTMFLINITRYPAANLPPYGINGGWYSWRSGYRLLQAFATEAQMSTLKGTEFTMPASLGDDRALFYADQYYPIPSLNENTGGEMSFRSTWSANKFTGRYSVDPMDGSSSSASSTTWPDTDIPLMRSAEAWLTYAEAQFRLGNTEEARNTIQTLRARANASTPATISEEYILDEWMREFYNEGRRRVDLVRFHQFAGSLATRTWEGHATPMDASYNTFPLPDITAAFPSAAEMYKSYKHYAYMSGPLYPEVDPGQAVPCDGCNVGEAYYDEESGAVYSINSYDFGLGGGGALRTRYSFTKENPFLLELAEFPYMQPVDQPEALPEVSSPEGAFVIMLHSNYNYGANLIVLGDYLNAAGEWIYSENRTKPTSHTTSGTNILNQNFARFDSIGGGWYKAVVYPVLEKDASYQATNPGYAHITGIAYSPANSTAKPQMIKEVHKLVGKMNYSEKSTGEFELSFSQLAYVDDPTYGRQYYSSIATDRVVYLSAVGYEPEPPTVVPDVDPTPGAVTVMIKFDVDPCEGNNIRFVGDYGNIDETWSFAYAHEMTPVGDGWYKIVLTPNASGTIMGRPVQCDANGVGYWDHDWTHSKQNIIPISGFEDRMLVNSGFSEYNLSFAEEDAYSGAVVYLECTEWNFICTYPREYTITVTLPDFCEAFDVEVVGSFEGWGGNPAALTLMEGNTYTVTVTAYPNSDWKIRGEGGWDKEILFYNESTDSWSTFGNFTFEEETDIFMDFSDPGYYKWNICD